MNRHVGEILRSAQNDIKKDLPLFILRALRDIQRDIQSFALFFTDLPSFLSELGRAKENGVTKK